jgi:hypothetical protein
MTPRRDRLGALCVVAALCLSACGATAQGGDTTSPAPAAVIGVGELPPPLVTTTSTVPTVAETTPETVAVTTTTIPFSAPGNRILMIGDSILASTSKRSSNDMCRALVPLGWRVAIEAEVSRGIDFGVDVVRARGDEGWDAALVFLGTNYGNDENAYLRTLNRIVTELGDIPIVLVTVSEYRDEVREVNQVVTTMPEVYDNISVVDWRAITAAYPDVLNEDGIHPTPAGREVLAEAVATHLGAAPTSPGSCLDSQFTDDSSGTIDGRPTGSGSGSGSGNSATTTTVRAGSATTTTVRAGTTTTTVRPATTTTTTTPSGGSGGSGGSTTTAPTVATTTTAPAVTVPTTPVVTAAPAPTTTGP